MLRGRSDASGRAFSSRSRPSPSVAVSSFFGGSGFPGASPNRRALTALATATRFASASLWISTSTDSSPSIRVMTSRSRRPGITVPSCLSRTGCPPSIATTSAPISSGVRNSLSVRTMYSTSPSRRIPLATFTFSAARRSLIVASETLWCRSISSDSSTLISFSKPPLTRTAATPGMVSSLRLSSSSAYARSWYRSASPESPIRRMGSKVGS